MLQLHHSGAHAHTPHALPSGPSQKTANARALTPSLDLSSLARRPTARAAGTISLKNLRRVAKELGENMTDDELQEVIDFCDKDGRGEILLEDFCSVLLAAQAQQQLAADAASVS